MTHMSENHFVFFFKTIKKDSQKILNFYSKNHPPHAIYRALIVPNCQNGNF